MIDYYQSRVRCVMKTPLEQQHALAPFASWPRSPAFELLHHIEQFTHRERRALGKQSPDHT